MKTKALISFSVTAKLTCAFVFPYTDCWFSHAAAHILFCQIVKLHLFIPCASRIVRSGMHFSRPRKIIGGFVALKHGKDAANPLNPHRYKKNMSVGTE